MHSSVVLSALFAAVAFATPVANPEYVTHVDYVTVVTTVYVDAGATATATSTSATSSTTGEVKVQAQAEPKRVRMRGHRHRYWYFSSKKAETQTTTTVTEPTETPAAVVESPSASQVASTTTEVKVEPVPEPSTTIAAAPESTSTTPALDSTEDAVVQKPTPTPEPVVVEKPKPSPTPEVVQQPASTPEKPSSGSYKETCLYHHNAHRANHSAPALEWDDELEAITRKIAETCVYAHETKTGGGGYGQNIAAGATAAEIGKVISDQFYNGEFDLYPGFGSGKEPDMSNFSGWGHLSQIIWKDTTKVACVTMDCTSKGLAKVSSNVPPHFTVCNYKSPGNVGGGYVKNILPPKGDSYVTGGG